MGLSWFTVSVVDNHEKWQNCSWAPHEFIYEGDYNSQQWGKCGLHTCRNCGFQYIPQFGITECLIQYKCSVNTPPPHAIRSG